MKKNKDRKLVQILVRSREDFQAMRKRSDNRLGKKADGSEQQNLTKRLFGAEDAEMINAVSDAARQQEKDIEKKLKSVLQRFPVYTEWLTGVKGVGMIAAGWIVGEYDIHIATTVSKMWQYTGLNPSMVRGKKRKQHKNGTYSIITTDNMIRGDKQTPGFISPFNKQLRTAMTGVLADGFIKVQNYYALEYYYPYKERLAQSENIVSEIRKKGEKPQNVKWSEAKKAHRDRAAKRYMIKMFLIDLFKAWRRIEGLPVRGTYQEEKLGHEHK